MSQRKTKLMWPEVIVRPNCGLSGTYVVSGRVKKYFRILDMEVIMLLMVWNAKVSIAPISFLIQEIPCNTKLYFIQERYLEIKLLYLMRRNFWVLDVFGSRREQKVIKI